MIVKFWLRRFRKWRIVESYILLAQLRNILYAQEELQVIGHIGWKVWNVFRRPGIREFENGEIVWQWFCDGKFMLELLDAPLRWSWRLCVLGVKLCFAGHHGVKAKSRTPWTRNWPRKVFCFLVEGLARSPGSLEILRIRKRSKIEKVMEVWNFRIFCEIRKSISIDNSL